MARQNITNAQGTYVITKNLLQEDVLTSFKSAEGNNRPQTEPNYRQTMKDVHLHMPPYKPMLRKLDTYIEH
eukprot:4198484-Ditylum_brightwellii.AAC.1